MNAQFQTDDSTTIVHRGLRLRIPGGMRIPAEYPYIDTGDRLIDRCEAAWSDIDGDGQPLNFRLVSPPGVGKNAAVYALAARRKQLLYIILGTEELTAEDLAVSAALLPDGKVEYVASPLLAAMLTGGICFIDEIAKMRPRALAPLSSVLDSRRTLSSALLGDTFDAEPDFRFCAAYNPTDVDAFDLAPWLKRRTLPELKVTPPDWTALNKIICSRNSAAAKIGGKVLKRIRAMNRDIDPGTAANIVSYARRLEAFAVNNNVDIGDEIEVAIQHILIDDAKPQEG